MGRALVLTEGGAAALARALAEQGWTVDACAPAAAAEAADLAVDLIACPFTYGAGQNGPHLLADLLEQHPEAGALLFGDRMPDGFADTLGAVPGVPTVRAAPDARLLRIVVDCALARPH
jgi:NAD(P)-dependent dehydrogenase (short-subunit alcohol dehydrogenase family)